MEYTISQVAYELYKQDWVDTYTTAVERLDALREYSRYNMECAEDGEEVESFEEWLWDVGYGGSFYVCYDEFLDAEYQDKGYIRALLVDEELIALYYQDIEAMKKKKK